MLQKRIDDHTSISRESLREAQELFHGHLKKVGLKHTEQRDTILRAFLETRHIANSAKADPEYGAGVAAAPARLAGGKEAADDRQSARRPKKEKADVGA